MSIHKSDRYINTVYRIEQDTSVAEILTFLSEKGVKPEEATITYETDVYAVDSEYSDYSEYTTEMFLTIPPEKV